MKTKLLIATMTLLAAQFSFAQTEQENSEKADAAKVLVYCMPKDYLDNPLGVTLRISEGPTAAQYYVRALNRHDGTLGGVWDAISGAQTNGNQVTYSSPQQSFQMTLTLDTTEDSEGWVTGRILDWQFINNDGVHVKKKNITLPCKTGENAEALYKSVSGG